MADYDNVCKFFKFGYCKHGDACRKLHLKEVCESTDNCRKRHPALCRYFSNYGRCKFHLCAYKHIRNETERKIDVLEGKLEQTNSKLQKILEILLSLKSEEARNDVKDVKEADTWNPQKLTEGTTISSESSSSLCSVDMSGLRGLSKEVSFYETTLQRARDLGLNHANPAYLDHNYEPACCDHRHIPGKGGHNGPVHGSQCCYHRCRTNPQYKSKKPD